MSNAILNRICNDENDPMLGVKICRNHGDLLSMQTSWSKDNSGRRFWSCPRYRVNAYNLFRWRDHEDVDIRSKFVILRLAKSKELEIDDGSHIKRSNKWVMKEKKKKTKYCNN
uniref:GRF-type domain-containing protein n=1 Tax=Solanum tuberosum TaxID=4113 RepID=M1AZH0_SOLTU